MLSFALGSLRMQHLRVGTQATSDDSMQLEVLAAFEGEMRPAVDPAS